MSVMKTIEVSEECVKMSKKGVKAVLEPCGQQIDQINSNVAYEVFFQNYLMVNKPCIISREMTTNWKSVQNWVDRKSGKPNFQYLKENFGNIRKD